jgi:hypothetical protein
MNYKKATGLIGGEIAMRIKNRKQLLQERKDEYTVFGRTSQDAEYDACIIEEIRELEGQLQPNPVQEKQE